MSVTLKKIAIRCAYTKLVPLAELAKLRNPENTNDHGEDQIIELVEQFHFQGVRHPIIISNRSGLFAAGDGRYLAADRAGMTEYPVDYQDFESAEQEFAFGVADNELQKWSLTNMKRVQAKLPEIAHFDVKRLAIKEFESPNFAPGTEDDQGKLDEKKPVTCPKCGESFVAT